MRFDVLVVGAGPGGCVAARGAAEGGASVLLLEKRPVVGLPVQCAEYAPAQMLGYVEPWPERCVIQRIRHMRTHLPDGEMVETPAAGYVLDRAAFDQALAVAACRAGATLWTSARAVARNGRAVVVRREGTPVEVDCRVVIGADGPRSTVGGWIGQRNVDFIDGLQVEAVLAEPQACTEVYFDSAYPGGYGWRFPKGETANVGVGVNRSMGGDPRQALDHLLARLAIPPGALVGRTAGPVPAGGSVRRLRVGDTILVGDAAGHTHPVTGAGIFAAVVSGTLAGQAAAATIAADDLSALDAYEREWNAFMAGPLRHALDQRRALDARWSDDAAALSAALRETWVAFKAYGRRRKKRVQL